MIIITSCYTPLIDFRSPQPYRNENLYTFPLELEGFYVYGDSRDLFKEYRGKSFNLNDLFEPYVTIQLDSMNQQMNISFEFGINIEKCDTSNLNILEKLSEDSFSILTGNNDTILLKRKFDSYFISNLYLAKEKYNTVIKKY